MNILIIEDNRDVSANLAEYLEDHGHIIDAGYDGLSGLHLAAVNEYDVIVLDLNLPAIDGLALCRRLREDAGKSTPVLMLTARDTLDDKLAGFSAGADDYLVKPFSLKELHARILALGRRHSGHKSKILKVSDLEFDLGTMVVTRGGEKLTLTPLHLKILEILMKESPNVVKKHKLEQSIWGETAPDSDALRTHIHALRNIVDKPYTKPLLHTVRGIGYRVVDSNAV